MSHTFEDTDPHVNPPSRTRTLKTPAHMVTSFLECTKTVRHVPKGRAIVAMVSTRDVWSLEAKREMSSQTTE